MPWSIRMLLMLALAGSVFQFYVLRRTTLALARVSGVSKKVIRIVAATLALWFSLYPIVSVGSYAVGTRGILNSLQGYNILPDALIVYPFWIGLIFSVQVAMILLIVDAVRLILFPLYKKHKVTWLKYQSWLVISLVCIGVVYTIARIYSDTFTVRTRQAELMIPELPSDLDGFRIVQIADLQADPRTNDRKLSAYVEEVNSLKPDLILFGGDLVTSGTDFIQKGGETIGKMEARHGIYACLGDHDYFSDKSLVVQSLHKHGVTVLDNIAAVVPIGSSYLSLTGITNVYRTRATDGVLDTIEKQRLHGPVNILLTHQPSPWLVGFAAEKGYNLFLAGHTHGGQIAFPLPGFLLTGSSFETDYVSGFYDVGSMLVSVNNGLGLTLAAVRYHAPAEVTLIVLRRQP
jgi:hypothetical protein